jgi:hypothetical protein
MRKLVPNPTTFLRSVKRFEANMLARQAMRNIHSLTLGSVACAPEHNLIEFVISLPSLQYLDVSNSAVSLRDLLLSCYYFLPRLETLIFKRNSDQAKPPPARTPQYEFFLSEEEEPEPRANPRFNTREKQVRLLFLHSPCWPGCGPPL